MPKRYQPFTVTLEQAQIDGLRALSDSLNQSASGILRGAAQAVIDDPSILLRPALSGSKHKRSNGKVSAGATR